MRSWQPLPRCDGTSRGGVQKEGSQGAEEECLQLCVCVGGGGGRGCCQWAYKPLRAPATGCLVDCGDAPSTGYKVSTTCRLHCRRQRCGSAATSQ
jgi:hypothetical protein